MKHEGWTVAARSMGVDLSPSQAELLDRYEALLQTRGAPLGLVAVSDLPRLRDRHVLDGLRGAAHLPARCGSAVDLGSGAGLPGVPIAIARPDVEVVLAETRRNRAAFLEWVVDDLRMPNVRVHPGRAEDLPRRFDACLARAFAPPATTWIVARGVLAPGGILLYWAGEGFDPSRDVPPDVQVLVPEAHPLAYGGPVVIMGPR